MITRPGSPSAWASTATIALSNLTSFPGRSGRRQNGAIALAGGRTFPMRSSISPGASLRILPFSRLVLIRLALL